MTQKPLLYVFSTLSNPTSIRVLRVNSFDSAGVPCADLKILDLDASHEPFHALSYTWGEPFVCGTRDGETEIPETDPTSTLYSLPDTFSSEWPYPEERSHNRWPVLIQGHVLFVSRNAFDALRYLFAAGCVKEVHRTLQPNTDPPNENPPIWIDAICINQSDNIEKASQVNLMRRIYQSAALVISWLGRETVEVRESASILKAIDSISMEDIVGKTFTQLYGKESPFQDVLRVTSGFQWGCLAKFLGRNYFSRTWIVQEIVVANHLVFLAGGVTWHHATFLSAMTKIRQIQFIRAYTAFLHRASPTPAEFNPDDNPAIHEEGLLISVSINVGNGEESKVPASSIHDHGLMNVESYRRRFREATLELAGILEHHRDLKATDPRDKVYGFLGLVDPALIQNVNVDYGESADVSTAFVQAARTIINQQNDLRLLSQVEHEQARRLHELPSWVPDWTVNRGTKPFCMAFPDRERRFAASKGLKYNPALNCQSPGRVLHVDGAMWDEIEHVGVGAEDLMKAGETGGDWALLTSFIKPIWPDYVDGGTVMKALRRTIIADSPPYPTATQFRDWTLGIILRQFGNGPTGTEFAKGKAFHIDLFRLWPEYRAFHMSGGRAGTLNRYQQDSGYQRDMEEAWSGFNQAIMRAMAGRRLILTRKRYLGLAPRHAQTGDSVWILCGADVPMVLRGNSVGNFRLIGESYIHGVMNGEAAGEVRSKIRPVKIL